MGDAPPPTSTPAKRPMLNRRALRLKARLWNVSTWILAACVGVFLLQIAQTQAGNPWLYNWGNFNADDALLGGQVWRFITFQFLHANLLHIGVNAVGLWVFGPMVERRVGRAKTLVLYLLCGIGGAVGYVALWQLGFIRLTLETPLIGASAGAFGLIAAAMALFPNRILALAMPPIDITIFRFGMVYLALGAFAVIAYGPTGRGNAGGEAAHLGGALAGFLLARNLGLIAWVERISPKRLRNIGHGSRRHQLRPAKPPRV